MLLLKRHACAGRHRIPDGGSPGLHAPGTVNRTLRSESYHYDLYYPGETTEGRVSRVDRVLHLYKLHGSINWRRRTSGGSDVMISHVNPAEDEYGDVMNGSEQQFDSSRILGRFPESDEFRFQRRDAGTRSDSSAFATNPASRRAAEAFRPSPPRKSARRITNLPCSQTSSNSAIASHLHAVAHHTGGARSSPPKPLRHPSGNREANPRPAADAYSSTLRQAYSGQLNHPTHSIQAGNSPAQSGTGIARAAVGWSATHSQSPGPRRRSFPCRTPPDPEPEA